MIISLLIGYITALLPIWDWNTRLELFAGTIVLSITCLAILIWLQEKRKVIKKSPHVCKHERLIKKKII